MHTVVKNCTCDISRLYDCAMRHVVIVCYIISMASRSSETYPGYVSVSVMDRINATKLEVIKASQTAGYIQTPGWGQGIMYPQLMDSVVRLEVPKRHTAMVTMIHLNVSGNRYKCNRHRARLALYENSMTRFNILWRCGRSKPMARKLLGADAILYVHFQSWEFPNSAFKVYFSVHKFCSCLKQLAVDTWNCSVPYFRSFKPHFYCDLTPQCIDKEDERECPYFSEECGLGFITLEKHCAFYGTGGENKSWREMEFWCLKRGGHMMNIRTPGDFERLLWYLKPLTDVWGFEHIVVGLHSSSTSLPMMYRHEFQHGDKVIAFYRSTNLRFESSFLCGSVALSKNDRSLVRHVTLIYGSTQKFLNVICEIPKKHGMSTAKIYPPNTIKLPPVSNPQSSHVPLVGCPLGHVTRDFLACDIQSACWSRDVKSCPAPLTPLPPSFICTNGFESVPYTLVCDIRHDCSDSSDENFCEFPPCDLLEPFQCDERECVPRNTICNGQKNCYNGVDEDLCSIKLKAITTIPTSPAIIHLDKNGHFVVRKLHQLELADLGPDACSETHFQCPDKGYCMPVFLRCNDVYDCLGREDEAGCDSYTCPGFYRCRGSHVCLHPEHLCDSIFQCPQNDDELLCEYDCPASCTCYGLAFYCVQPFQASDFRNIRFLDGRGSGMKPNDLLNNVMLVYLSLTANDLTTVSELTFPNLHTLDLSDNNLNKIHLHYLTQLPQLQTLSLSGNPLISLFQDVSRSAVSNVPPGGSDVIHNFLNASIERASLTLHPISELYHVITSLRTLDLSRVRVKVLNPSFLSVMPNLHTVNISGGGVDTLLDAGFRALTQLRSLDLRGCPMTYFPRHVLQGLEKLETVYSDNYKLCCSATLPAGFVLKNCHAPYNEISSCEALLRSNSYRVFLSVFAVLTILGNVGSFVYRVFMQRGHRRLSFDIFVTHLSVADFWMGVYLSMIGVADHLYQGTYIWEDNTWKKGAPCKMAGFLCLLSSEVSVLVICLITIDRFLVLRFPFSTSHFGTRSAHVATLCVWGTGSLIAAVPLLPWIAHWQFYSRTGMCIPLPVSKADFPGYTYSFGVTIMANFVFFIVIAAGQVFVYWSVQANSLTLGEKTRKSEDLVIARRLITVAMSDLFCWFPIGVIGTMGASGITIPSEVNVAMSIFVLPFNSALNPFLYTLNLVLEKRRRLQEDRIKKRLTANFRSINGEEKHTSVHVSTVS